MSDAGEAIAAAAVAAAPPAESLKRERDDVEGDETTAKRANVTDADSSAVAGAATEASTTAAATEGAAAPVAAAADSAAAAAPAAATAPDICMRLLMTNKMVGMVIGKGGDKIRRVRETSGCHITFSDNYPGVQDRVLMVTGQHDHVKAAMNVIVVQLEQDTAVTNGSLPNPPRAGALTLKILVPQSQIGAVIGKGGSMLDSMRASTGAQIHAAAEVLPNSTDRPVSLTGTAQAIIACIESTMDIFQANPVGPSQVQYRPAPAPAPAPGGYGGYGPQPGYGSPAGGPRMGGGHGGYGAPPPQHQPGGYGAPPPQAVAQQTMQQFTIANDLVGCVIGRGGSEINAMRKQSGANIRIHQPEPGQSERLVTVSGTQEQVAMAHFLLTNKLQQEVNSNWAPGGSSGGAPAAPQQAQQPYY